MATVRKPSSVAARMMRMAISLRLRASSFFICGFCGSFRSGIVIRCCLWTQQIHGVSMRCERQVQCPNHHLFPTLVAPADFFCGVRVGRVVSRIVEPGGEFDTRAPGKSQRPLEVILELPGKIVVGDTQKHLRPTG